MDAVVAAVVVGVQVTVGESVVTAPLQHRVADGVEDVVVLGGQPDGHARAVAELLPSDVVLHIVLHPLGQLVDVHSFLLLQWA